MEVRGRPWCMVTKDLNKAIEENFLRRIHQLLADILEISSWDEASVRVSCDCAAFRGGRNGHCDDQRTAIASEIIKFGHRSAFHGLVWRLRGESREAFCPL
jgi:hypothetical protein